MLEITLRPTLLAYQNTVAIDDRVIILDIEYHQRTDDWWISFLDEELQPILTGRRVVGYTSLTGGEIDDRLPSGVFMALLVGDVVRDAEGRVSSRPRAGELGRSWRLVYYTLDELLALDDGVDLLEPRSIVVS